jgi:hypothetical protein
VSRRLARGAGEALVRPRRTESLQRSRVRPRTDTAGWPDAASVFEAPSSTDSGTRTTAGGMPARAFLRGNSAISFDLSFAYIEPYVLPKTELSGASTERVDTRVLQVVYSVIKGDLPIYAGQQLDVYIETPVR